MLRSAFVGTGTSLAICDTAVLWRHLFGPLTFFPPLNRCVHTCQSVPNVLLNMCILTIVPNYMSVFDHQTPRSIYFPPSVNIPVRVVIICLSKNTLIFRLKLRKHWLCLIVEFSCQSQLIRDGYSVTIQLQDNEYPVTTFCTCESTNTGDTIITRRFFRTQSYITEICYFEYLQSLLFGWQKPFFSPVQSNIKPNYI